MIEQISYTNFQPHESLVLDLDPLCTTIIGPNSVGKSSILRGLRWLAFNQRFRGDITTWDKEFVRVRAIVDGKIITRHKGSTNIYKLDGTTFKAVATTVPEEVNQLFNLDDLNFQQQLDGPFWFTASAGEVSRDLNRIINLGVIDDTLSNAASKLRALHSRESLFREELGEARIKLRALDWVKGAQESWDKVQAAQQKQEATAGVVASLTVITKVGSSLANRVTKAESAHSRGLVALSNARDLTSKATFVYHLDKLIQSTEQALRGAKIQIPDISALTKAWDNEVTTAAEVDELSELVDAIEQGEAGLCQREKFLQDSESKKKKATGGQTCPVCKRPFHPGTC